MKITDEIKEKVVNALLRDMQERGFTSQNEYAGYIRNMVDIPFDKSAFSSIKKAEKRHFLKDASWLKLAKHFNVLSENSWQTAETNTYITVNTHLDACKTYGVWQVLCDRAGIGKSYAAQAFAKRHKETVFYVDCSEYFTKSDFIMALARQLGMEKTGSYNQLWRDVTNELLLCDNPLLILDEFGDVHESVITLMKSLYNKADMGDHLALGVYFIGADNLRKRLKEGKRKQRQSYAEFWSRFNEGITDLNFTPRPDAFQNELRAEIEKIVDANLPAAIAKKRDEVVENCLRTYGVRSIRKEIAKQVLMSNL